MERYIGSNVTVDFLPWFENGYILKTLRLKEELGGTIAYGSMKLELVGTDESFKLVTTQYTGKLIIKKDEGSIYEIDVFITDRKYYKNSLIINFLCIKDRLFNTKLVSLEHSDITTALNSLYPGKIDIRCESDINNNIPLIQNTETNHEFCNKLAMSFRKNVIFGYSWDRFLLKEKIGIDSQGNQEPKIVLIGNAGVEIAEVYNLQYTSMLFEKSWDPWLENETIDYTEKAALNSKTLKLHNGYVTVGTDYSDLMRNYLYNTTQEKYNMFVSLKVKSASIPEYRLGDIVSFKELKDKGIPGKIYLVKSNELVIVNEGPSDNTGSKVSMVSLLVGVEFGTKILPEIDPLDEINEEGAIPE